MVTRRELFAIRNILSDNPGAVLYVKPDGDDGLSGLEFSGAKATIQAAVDAASDGDLAMASQGEYDETVTIETGNVTVQGVGGRGAAYIEPSAAGAEGMLVLADDVTIRNIGVAADDTADHSLKVGSQTVSPARFRAYECKFESKPVILQGAGDALFEDCEFAWSENGLLFAANDDGFCTQVTLRRCRFHNITEKQLANAASGGVVNLVVEDCVFDNAEDGTPPTFYIDVDRAGDTGIVTGCKFATATHEADVISLAAGVMYVSNHAESGASTARPS